MKRLLPDAGAAHAVRVAVAAAVIGAAVAFGGADDEAPGGAPPDAAARLVPADALVYVNLSIDGDREATRRAAAIAERFPGYAALRDDILRRLAAPGCPVRRSDLRGREAALALLDTGSARTAGSLVLFDAGRDRRLKERACGALRVASIGRFVVIGQVASLRAARALAGGRGGSLAQAPDYRRAVGAMPADRVATAWVTGAGAQRLLQPQGGLLGAIGLLLDQPSLRGAGVAVAAHGEEGARVWVRSFLDATPRRAFQPRLADEIPAGAMAYLGVSGLSGSLPRLLAIATASTTVTGLVTDLQRALADLVRGEVALVLTPAVPAPVLTVLAPVRSEAAARRALARLPARVRERFESAVFDGKLAISTAPSGLSAVRLAGPRLREAGLLREVLSDARSRVTSLVFLDFNRLLRLAEQTGLNESRAYLRVRQDLRHIRAIGAHVSGDGSESTAEILLSIR